MLDLKGVDGRALTELGRVPERIKVDNGSEFISKALDKWAYDNLVTLNFSRPGKPTDNAFIESFNGCFRDECLIIHWFLSLADAGEKIEAWQQEYYSFRPHSSLWNDAQGVGSKHRNRAHFSTLSDPKNGGFKSLEFSIIY